MEEEGGGIRLSKRFNDKNSNGEVDYKTKSGTAWSHSYLNQKPWHPLSYPNQRRKWIAEQTHAQRERRAEEVAREYAQEQEFFRQTALISKKEKEKIEMMKAVSFMYVRPPGYNAESAKAAEIADEEKTTNPSQDPAASSSVPATDPSMTDKKNKPRPKDAFGRNLPTEQEFEVLNNAPRLDTGAPARAKPFGIEVRNVKCLRCGKYGHQSGDRECPLKDAIMPNEESRLRRDDPLTAIIAQTDQTEPLKWELKQKPGMSPPRGGFNPDDPNQQIVAEDIFDEYGGFLSGGSIPELLTNFCPSKPHKKLKKSKRRRESAPGREVKVPESFEISSSSDDGDRRSNKKKKKKKQNHSIEDTDSDRHHKRKRSSQKYCCSSEEFDSEEHHRRKDSRKRHSNSSEESDWDRHRRSKDSKTKHSYSSEFSDRHRKSKDYRKKLPYSSKEVDLDGNRRGKDGRRKHSHSSEHISSNRHHRSEKKRYRHSYPYSSDDCGSDEHCRNKHKSCFHGSESDSFSE